MLDLKPIRVFLEVARLQSFAAAARALGLTPASVTRIVARLEADLGQQLLVRTTRAVALTSAGARVVARFGAVVEDFDRISEELRRETDPHQGRLCVNAPLSFGLKTMPGLVESFALAYPGIDLRLRLTDSLVDLMEEGDDLAIRISLPPTDKSTIWRKICAVPRFAVAAPGVAARVASIGNLTPRLCLSYAAGAEPETWRLSRGAERRLVTAGTHLMADSGDFLLEMARGGAGIAVLPEFIVRADLDAGRVVAVLEDWEVEPLWLSLYYPPYSVLPPLVETFTEFFEAYLADREGFDFRAG